MSVRYTISGRLLHLYLEGTYAPGDVVTTFDRALEDPALPMDARLVIDVRQSDVFQNRETADIQRVAEAFRPRAHRVGGRCAMLVSSQVQYGVARMGAAFAEARAVEARVFTDLGEALAWLGLDPSQPPSKRDTM